MGWDKLMETLRQRLKEQQGRHQGGSKWIGTAGTSPFGAHGYNPEGVRIGQEKNRTSRGEGLGPPRVQGSRRQRRTRHPQHQDRAAAVAQIRPHRGSRRTRSRHHHPGDRHHGYLDVHMRPERRNAVKVLVFFDIGGSMDSHIVQVEELFSRRKANSSTWNISTSTTACMKACGSRTGGASPTAPDLGRAA